MGIRRSRLLTVIGIANRAGRWSASTTNNSSYCSTSVLHIGTQRMVPVLATVEVPSHTDRERKEGEAPPSKFIVRAGTEKVGRSPAENVRPLADEGARCSEASRSPAIAQRAALRRPKFSLRRGVPSLIARSNPELSRSASMWRNIL
jgi:hypothetical protein